MIVKTLPLEEDDAGQLHIYECQPIRNHEHCELCGCCVNCHDYTVEAAKKKGHHILCAECSAIVAAKADSHKVGGIVTDKGLEKIQ